MNQEYENIKKDLYVLDNEVLALQKKIVRILDEILKTETKIRWIIQKKKELNYRVYKFTKENEMTVIRVVPDTTLIQLEYKLSELLAMLGRVRLDVEWLDRSFSELK